jgi:hypothetical protein
VRRRLPGLWQKGRRMTPIVTLSDGLDPLRQWFNDKSAFARIIAIQSPT